MPAQALANTFHSFFSASAIGGPKVHKHEYTAVNLGAFCKVLGHGC